MASATPTCMTRKWGTRTRTKPEVPIAGYRPYFAPDCFRCKARHYRVPNGDGKHVVYTYIRKNACSSFKALFLAHAQLTRKHGLEYAKSRGLGALREFHPKWWQGRCDMRMFVYRHPFDRCVSAFVNKFVEARDNGDIFTNFAARTGKSPETATFEDFVAYIDGPFGALDCHVWPQKSHLSDKTYTHAIDMHMLSQVMGAALPSLAPYFSQPANASNWRSQNAVLKAEPRDLSAIPADQIRALGAYSKVNFDRLRAEVEAKYAVDMEMIADIKKAACTPRAH